MLKPDSSSLYRRRQPRANQTHSRYGIQQGQASMQNESFLAKLAKVTSHFMFKSILLSICSLLAAYYLVTLAIKWLGEERETVDCDVLCPFRKQPVEKWKELEECPHHFVVPEDYGGSDCDVGKWPVDCNRAKTAGVWEEMYSGGKEKRQQHIAEMLITDGSPIILTIFNHGFAHLFLNWVCSLESNELSVLKASSLIVVTSEESKALALKTGFQMVLHLNDVVDLKQIRVGNAASRSFGRGDHKKITSLQMMLLSDLIELGHDVVMMDIDVVFQHDPLQYIRDDLLPLVDVWTMLAPRWDALGPANSGFIVMRSNCRTKAMMLKMMQYMGMIHAVDDQQTFNFWLNWKPFRQIAWRLLDRTRFIGGDQVTLLKSKPSDFSNAESIVAFHAFGTGDHWDKLIKFHQMGHWYFTEERCPANYDANFVRDLSDRGTYDPERPKAQRNHWIQSNGYLLEHGLITDRDGIFQKAMQEVDEE